MATRTIALSSATRTRRGQTMFGWLLSLDAKTRQRAALKQLDAHLMADIGLSDTDRNAELARPVWDAPANWRT